MLTHVLPRVARGGVRGLPPRGFPQGNTCVSMAKMRKMSPKTIRNDRFFVEILNFFGKAQDQLKLRFIVFFDVLKL